MFVVVAALFLQSYGEIKSGMIEFKHPTSEPFNVDFSDQLLYKTNMKSDSVSTDSADLIFTNPSIVAPYGIQKVSLADFYQKYIKGKILTTSSEVLPYLDTVAKEFKLSKASLTILDTLQTKASIECDSVMLAKTRDGGVVLLLRAYTYVGGYNRYLLYWVYQPSGDTVFYKNDLIHPIDSLTITLNIFSGRHDPVFTVKDKKFATELVTRLSCSFNKFLNPSAQIEALDTSTNIWPFPSMWIHKYESDSEYPAYHFINDIIFFHRMPQPISSYIPPAIKDDNYKLLRFIIKNGILNDIESSDMYGVIRFKDLFPENIIAEIDTCSKDRLRQLLSRQTDLIQKCSQYTQTNSRCKATLCGSSLTLNTDPGMINCAVFGIDGTMVKKINIKTSGSCTLPMKGICNRVLFVKGTVTLENGLKKKLSMRVIR
jgi:hypothetical protein